MLWNPRARIDARRREVEAAVQSLGMSPILFEVRDRARFEAAFAEASTIISRSPGYVSHELHRCLEVQEQYLLLVRWETLQDHTIGFRKSDRFQKWREALHHFYDPMPTILHYSEPE
jgi:heme-degrading monooxygenase HmoA